MAKSKSTMRQRDGVERQVPGRIPRILPLVRHGDHVGVQHVKPIHVARAAPGGLEQRMALVLLKPPIQIEVVELLAPEHARQRLAVHAPLVLVQRLRGNPGVEFVRVGDSALDDVLEVAEGLVPRAAARRRRMVLLPPAGTSRA